MRRALLACALWLVAVYAPQPLRGQQVTGVIRGVVYDSIAQRPLGLAAIRVMSVRDTTTVHEVRSDSLGRFELPRVDGGPWIAYVHHPRLDSLALRELVAPITVRPGRTTRLSVAVPSARVLAQRACGVNRTTADTSGFLLGRLRRAVAGAPPTAGLVRVQWLELVLTGTKPVRELFTVDATADSTGAFLACGIPANASVLVRAFAGADSSGRAQLAIPSTGVRYRDLYVGASTMIEVPAPPPVIDSTLPTDSLVESAPLQYWRGSGQVRGVIRDASGRALVNARVAVPLAGREVRTDTIGRFQLDQLPAGTQAIEVRALGFDPLSDAVDVAPDAAPLTLALARFESLDTVRVRANRPRPNSQRFADFETRRKTGFGKFFTSADIDRLNLLRISDLFSQVGGIVMMWRNGERVPTMRGLTFRGRCIPMFIVDGFPYPNDASLDAFIAPMSVIGVEVYSTAFTPGEFSRPFAPCGTIVIWTGERPAPPTPSRERKP
jgi:hypothetical protein